MFKIVAKEKLCPVIDFFKIEASAVAKKAKAGQFVVIRVDEVGERIPLTLADWDEKEGTLTLVAMRVGTTTFKLASLNTGDHILDGDIIAVRLQSTADNGDIVVALIEDEAVVKRFYRTEKGFELRFTRL